MGKMSLSSDSLWELAMLNIENEKRIVALLESWCACEELPCDITVSTDNGYRCFIYFSPGTLDTDKHRFLSWLIRHSGKKFIRFVRDGGTAPTWWNTTYAKDIPTDNNQVVFGKDRLNILFLVEDMPLGTCKIVKVKKEVEVTELVCK